MKIRTIDFAREFTDAPGGRYRINSDCSGEEFRKDFLEPSLEANGKVILNLEGVFAFPASFLDEAFGVLVHEKGFEYVKSHLELVLPSDPNMLRSIWDVMERHMA